MLCQHCGARPATTHIRRTIDGVTEELRLCDECAAKLGYDQLSILAGGLLGSLFGTELTENHPGPAGRCPGCGVSFEEIARTGRVGCAKCYERFADRLTPTIEQIHGRASYAGERPRKKAPAEKPADPRQALQKKLDEAVKAQEFEEAARLRDEIRKLEREEGQQNGND